ncbi:glycosyltransferase [Planctomicrobium sp. SH664]|uniref:glycosyltransferase n=1 Tax=Planctomicrobium sp. SH664 TaxID=3448125 RepID=UPI003F5AE750
MLLPYAFIVLTWVVILLMTSWGLRRMVRLTTQSERWGRQRVPSVSILVPARNEAGNIRKCLDSLLEQNYPSFELLVIDDRSTDETPQIVREIANRDPRVRLLQIEHLPDGWTGKNHALHVGSQQVNGEWLLFVDADTQHHPDNLSIVLEYAEKERADLVTLIPTMTSISFWERVVHPMACVVSSFFNDPLRTNNPRCRTSAYGNGQYMLFRRSAYDDIGGHESVRTEFVEDMQLARNIKSRDHTLKVALAAELTQTRMFGSLGEVYRGWSRILYGSVDKKPWRLIMLTLGLGTIVISAFVAWPASLVNLLSPDPNPKAWIWFSLANIHIALILIVTAPLYRLTNNQRRYLAFYPVAFTVMSAILFRAIWLCMTHRVTWRGTQYGASMREKPVVRPTALPRTPADTAVKVSSGS